MSDSELSEVPCLVTQMRNHSAYQPFCAIRVLVVYNSTITTNTATTTKYSVTVVLKKLI